MEVVRLNNIKKSDGVIYYRRQYSAVAEINLPNGINELPLEFTIETGPLGDKIFEMDFNQNIINYPFLPLQKALKDYILKIDEVGALPL